MLTYRTWIEVDTVALARNYRAFRRLLARPTGLGIGPEVRLMAVVKSNAYGHGLVDFSRLIAKLGADWLGVDSIVEAVALRRAGIKKDILVLGYTQPSNFSAAARGGVTLTISSLDSLRSLLAEPRPPQFHLKIDTGMHRQGFGADDLARAIALLSRAAVAGRSRAQFTGAYSHLAAASSAKHATATRKQVAAFESALAMFTRAGFPRESFVKHLAATGSTIGYPAARYDLVRVGFGLYGLWPSAEWRRRFGNRIKLRPVLSWKTIISEVKILTDGGAIGYDFTERVKPGTKIAVCPIGYWHGFPRALSGIGEVMARGKRAKVIGRVSMDMIVVDVTHISGLKIGDTVTLIGDGLPAEFLADRARTSPYEILTRLNPLIQKFYRP